MLNHSNRPQALPVQHLPAVDRPVHVPAVQRRGQLGQDHVQCALSLNLLYRFCYALCPSYIAAVLLRPWATRTHSMRLCYQQYAIFELVHVSFSTRD